MKRPARIAIVCLTVGGGAVTLLLWAKLKLVAGIPRTVYAEPELTDDSAQTVLEQADVPSEAHGDQDRADHKTHTPSPSP
jgi:hypothetical protein